MIITKDMNIKELIAMDERIAGILRGEGMNCIGCTSAESETLEEAALAHGVDPILLERKLNFRINMMK